MSTATTLQRILELVQRGGSGAEYIGKAYISYYRGIKHTVDLRESRVLDNTNLQLLFDMISIRRQTDWTDEEMYAVEVKIKALLADKQ